MPINRMKDLALVVYFENLTDTLPLFRYIILSHYTFVHVLYNMQPPKKKSGKKGKKGKKSGKAKTPTVIDGIPTEEMTKEQVTIFFTVSF